MNQQPRFENTVSSLMADYLKRLTGKPTLEEAVLHFEVTTLESFTDPSVLIKDLEKHIGIPNCKPCSTYPLLSKLGTEE